jgi:hypothetical protein
MILENNPISRFQNDESSITLYYSVEHLRVLSRMHQYSRPETVSKSGRIADGSRSDGDGAPTAGLMFVTP